jgi:outer membrane protein OmpA-like peptidoglycan-associated protein
MNHSLKIAVSVAVMLMMGCATTDPYTGEQKTSNTAKNAGIGALAGAVLGAVVAGSDDRGEGAAIGALVGAGIGGGYGHYMDQQETALRQQLQDTGVQVKREGDTIRLIMPGNITFAVDSYDIRSDFYSVLKSVALVLKEYSETIVDIGGHTDSTGSFEYNQKLSEQRADSVARYLSSQQLDANRLKISGYGPRYPIASNDSAEGRLLNRRVEIQLLPLSR